MDQCESQTKAQSLEQLHRPDSPGPGPQPDPGSSVSLKSDRSMDRPILFRDVHRQSDHGEVKHQRPDSPGPAPSCGSLKSDHYMSEPLLSKSAEPGANER